MSTEGVLRDILRQPESLACILEYHRGPGREELEQAAALLCKASTVILTGMGASLFACIPLEYYLAAKGCRVVLVETAELLHYQRERCCGAVVVMVSRSGDTIEITKLLEALADRHIATIGVTNEPGGYLARKAGIVLPVNGHPDELVAIQSYTGQLATLLLLGAMATDGESEFTAAFERVLKQMTAVADACLDACETWREFFEGAPVVHLIGRGPSFGSCAEGALLFSELVKLPAVAQPAGLFRHGPVEAVNCSFRGIVFAPAGRTRRLNLDLARDLTAFGSQVYAVGPVDPTLQGVHFWEVPEIEETFSPLLEVVPLQFAAWRAAQWRGIVPGDLRYVARVTLDEAKFQV